MAGEGEPIVLLIRAVLTTLRRAQYNLHRGSILGLSHSFLCVFGSLVHHTVADGRILTATSSPSDRIPDIRQSRKRILSVPPLILELGPYLLLPPPSHSLTRCASVPICLAGSRLTTDQILSDFNMPSPWQIASAKETYHAAQKTKSLDERHRHWTEELLPLFIIISGFMMIFCIFAIASPAVARYAVIARASQAVVARASQAVRAEL